MKSYRSQKFLYAEQARKRFCKGTCFIAPVDLISSGQRTLEQWTAILGEERDHYHLKTTKPTRARRSDLNTSKF